MNKPMVVNLYGAPGTGKSTIASELFAKCKWLDINCELVNEFAKELTWEERHKTLRNQTYIYAKQQHKMFRVKDHVDLIITDCPLTLSYFYDKLYGAGNALLQELIIHEESTYYNVWDFLLTRTKAYNPIGRNQSELESDKIARDLKLFLDINKPHYESLAAVEQVTSSIILNKVITTLAGTYPEKYIQLNRFKSGDLSV